LKDSTNTTIHSTGSFRLELTKELKKAFDLKPRPDRRRDVGRNDFVGNGSFHLQKSIEIKKAQTHF
jgi:hypothetical protein